MLRLAAAGVLLSALAAGQANYTYYGPQCGAQLTVGNGWPIIGRSFDVQYTGPNVYSFNSRSYGWSRPILLIGAYSFAQQPWILPASPSCALLCSAEIVLMTPLRSTVYESVVTIPVPNNPAFVGMNIYNQWLTWNYSVVYIPPYGGSQSLRSSNGGKATVGL